MYFFLCTQAITSLRIVLSCCRMPENIDAIHEVIKQYRHVIYGEIERSLGVSLHNILHDPLAKKNMLALGPA